MCLFWISCTLSIVIWDKSLKELASSKVAVVMQHIIIIIKLGELASF